MHTHVHTDIYPHWYLKAHQENREAHTTFNMHQKILQFILHFPQIWKEQTSREMAADTFMFSKCNDFWSSGVSNSCRVEELTMKNLHQKKRNKLYRNGSFRKSSHKWIQWFTHSIWLSNFFSFFNFFLSWSMNMQP